MASSFAAAFGLKDEGLLQTKGYIAGRWRDALDGATISVSNPATGEEIGTVPEMGVKETQEAITAAQDSFKAWKRTTAKVNRRVSLSFERVLTAPNLSIQMISQKFWEAPSANSVPKTHELNLIQTLENGKTLNDAKAEITYSSSFIEWFAEEAVRTYGETIPAPVPGIRNVTVMQPVGVCAILTPWNFPSAMITRKLGPALAAGCTVVVKPPPETPFSALALVELARRAGFPDGVINVVTTMKNVGEVGKELCENTIVRKVTFTGSTAVAKLLYSMSASTMKKISFEAGGNSPFIVFDDADIDAAVEGAALCKYRASGQTCVCANRIYVHSSVYAEFASRLAAKVATFKVGSGLDKETTHGPLIHDRAIKKVEEHVADAVGKGAQVLIGGSRLEGPGSFFAPTILSDVPPNVRLSNEETFGPVAALIKFETEEEVLKLANDTQYGLAGYFYSRDIGRVWRVAEALEVGMVGANTGMISSAVIPFGGVKESGLGREGAHGIQEYMQTKLIAFGGV
ncbi:succinate-semialdehyde dehydrogenase [Sanghuangporus baumii]|uniref:Succinate-semialdehyde dehydrogenase, mitochondrial n=1 Tax=Sanghuangporus baumii TaxID=108892 RepID=A0A9Q5HRA8_SANBA|nr:succinate-semialdehyde dehydrogenase [Sanghuangporus baumii]